MHHDRELDGLNRQASVPDSKLGSRAALFQLWRASDGGEGTETENFASAHAAPGDRAHSPTPLVQPEIHDAAALDWRDEIRADDFEFWD